MLVLVPQQGRRSPPSQSPVAVGRVPRGQAASGTRLFSAPARDEGGLGVTFPICGILPHSGHVGAQQEQVSHGWPHFLPFIVKVSTKPLPGPWRARLRPPELPAWPWPLVFSFHSHYLWGHLKGSNWSPMEFHPVSDEMDMNSTSPWSPTGTMWLCGHSQDCVQGWHHKTAPRGQNMAPKQPGKQECVTLEVMTRN